LYYDSQGFSDGDLTHAEFYNPLDVTRGPNNTVWVADEQRIRIVELPNVISEFYSIRSRGRVSTIAGTSLQVWSGAVLQCVLPSATLFNVLAKHTGSGFVQRTVGS
jgi:hypothetical protein